MNEPTFTVQVFTPERTVLSTEAISLVAPGFEGSFGVLAHHAPMLIELRVGELRITTQEGKEKRLAISGGFAEIYNNTVRVLADSAELAEEIDIERAEAARRRAEERLRTHHADTDIARAEAALHRATNRLRVASKHSQ